MLNFYPGVIMDVSDLVRDIHMRGYQKGTVQAVAHLTRRNPDFHRRDFSRDVMFADQRFQGSKNLENYVSNLKK